MLTVMEKRWLVVGIALDKVLAPVLREFVKQTMEQHYENLDKYCKILPMPCTLKTLTYRHVVTDPIFRPLKFGNVNNNHLKHRMHRANYNYRVSNSINLAKLYLPDYLANVSAFDESLDLSAILLLLTHQKLEPIYLVPDVPNSVQSSADDVRKNVRNMWARAYSTDWTDAVFNNCFSKLKTLVESLGLADEKKKRTLDELSYWQGRLVCSNKAG